jgi:hypothetical protein
MGRIAIAILFVFAVVSQNASSADTPDGIRAPAADAPLSRLTECSECDDASQNLLFLKPTIAPATLALERLVELTFDKRLHQPQHSHRHSVPLFEWHAVWRI